MAGPAKNEGKVPAKACFDDVIKFDEPRSNLIRSKLFLGGNFPAQSFKKKVKYMFA